MKMETFLIYFFVCILCVHGNATNSRIEQQFEKCCGLGASWAGEGLRCEKFTGPVSGIPMVEQAMCLETVDICCARTYHQKSCERGISNARQSLTCSDNLNSSGIKKYDDYQRDCCEGCKLGILSGSLGQNCAFKAFSFGKPWDSAFLECCEAMVPSTTPKNAKNASTTINSTEKTPSTLPITHLSEDLNELSDVTSSSIPTPSLDNICELLKGMLCSDICVPTPGSYYCQCPEGYVLLEDQKTCRTDGSLTTQSSTPSTTISTTPLSTKPTGNMNSIPRCPLGYRYNSSVRACDDIDECETKPCSSGDCKNTIGSYMCENATILTRIGNDDGEAILNNRQLETCPPGYVWDQQHQICADVDECSQSIIEPCPKETHFCVNTQGSFACHELSAPKACPAGFKFDALSKMCQDVDECAEELHGCLPEVEECRNTDGAYECDIKCRKGYVFSRSHAMCIDVDECVENENPCPDNKPRCVNHPGAYECTELEEALDNYEGTEDDNDANEITEPEYELIEKDENAIVLTKDDSKPQKQRVANRPCAPGYRFDGSRCGDIDECTEGPGCREHERCLNRMGSYDCLPLCKTGWYFNKNSKSCQDVDECLLGRHNCSEITHTCYNTDGSFVCRENLPCGLGYSRAANGSCIDIDECVNELHNCSVELHQYCVNRRGGFDCLTRLPECDSGYEYSLVSRKCEDIDECSNAKNFPCDRRLQERCVNIPGSYRCERPVGTTNAYRRRPACPTGYRYDNTKRRCEDINECAERLDICGHEVCYNQPGGYSCAAAPAPIIDTTLRPSTYPTIGPMRCEPGFRYKRNYGCADINECREIEEACTSDEECINTIGSYTCNCKLGFRRDELTQACVDINECQLPNDCLPTQRCDNTVGSYTCVRHLPCGTGYTLNAVTEICEDDDECALSTHDCGEGYHCRNTLGSYRCDRNPRGYTRPPTTVRTTHYYRPTTTTTTSRPTPSFDTRIQPNRTCSEGFRLGPSGQCIDVDECALGPLNPCNRFPLQECVNTIGSYRCVPRLICSAGFKLDPKSHSHCVDIDECADGTHKCGPRQTCENRQGGYTCSCPAGYALGPNQDCVDINECSLHGANVCGTTGKCENTMGSFRCVCESGFEKLPGSHACGDIDECQRTPNICQHKCINIWGGYRCVCQPGFTLNHDNRSCSDVDECEVFKANNPCVGFCDNTPGSYSCRCPAGYRLGTDGRTCQDIDECATGRICMDPNEMCQNTRGGYRCNRIHCPPGYHQDQQRKNRCVRSSHYCLSGDIACYQSPSHFSYNFITFVSMLPIPRTGQLELFTMRSAHLPGSVVRFSMALVDSRAAPGVTRATEACFALRRPSTSQAVLVLTRSLPGPQEIQLDLSMEIYHDTAFVGSAVAKLFIYVTQYEF